MKNAFAHKMQEQRRVQMDVQRQFTIQQCADVMCLMLNEEFGFGKQRCARAVLAFSKLMDEFIALALEDDQDDRSLTYTMTKLDQGLKAIFHDDTIDFKKRYGMVKWRKFIE